LDLDRDAAETLLVGLEHRDDLLTDLDLVADAGVHGDLVSVAGFAGGRGESGGDTRHGEPDRAGLRHNGGEVGVQARDGETAGAGEEVLRDGVTGDGAEIEDLGEARFPEAGGD
jgi:hypothetical protein